MTIRIEYKDCYENMTELKFSNAEIDVNDTFVCIKEKKKTYYIPKNRVLSIQVSE